MFYNKCSQRRRQEIKNFSKILWLKKGTLQNGKANWCLFTVIILIGAIDWASGQKLQFEGKLGVIATGSLQIWDEIEMKHIITAGAE